MSRVTIFSFAPSMIEPDSVVGGSAKAGSTAGATSTLTRMDEIAGSATSSGAALGLAAEALAASTFGAGSIIISTTMICGA